MQTYRQQIDDMENYMATLTGEMAISPQGILAADPQLRHV